MLMKPSFQMKCHFLVSLYPSRLFIWHVLVLRHSSILCLSKSWLQPKVGEEGWQNLLMKNEKPETGTRAKNATTRGGTLTYITLLHFSCAKCLSSQCYFGDDHIHCLFLLLASSFLLSLLIFRLILPSLNQYDLESSLGVQIQLSYCPFPFFYHNRQCQCHWYWFITSL